MMEWSTASTLCSCLCGMLMLTCSTLFLVAEWLNTTLSVSPRVSWLKEVYTNIFTWSPGKQHISQCSAEAAHQHSRSTRLLYSENLSPSSAASYVCSRHHETSSQPWWLSCCWRLLGGCYCTINSWSLHVSTYYSTFQQHHTHQVCQAILNAEDPKIRT